MHSSDDPKLTAYVLGELDAAETAEVEARLAESAELRGAVAEIRRTSEVVGSVLQAEPCPELSEQQRAAIDRESDEPRVAKAQREPAANRRAWLVASVVAALLVIAAIGSWNLWGTQEVADISPTFGGRPDDEAEERDGKLLPSPFYIADDEQFYEPGSFEFSELQERTGAVEMPSEDAIHPRPIGPPSSTSDYSGDQSFVRDPRSVIRGTGEGEPADAYRYSTQRPIADSPTSNIPDPRAYAGGEISDDGGQRPIVTSVIPVEGRTLGGRAGESREIVDDIDLEDGRPGRGGESGGDLDREKNDKSGRQGRDRAAKNTGDAKDDESTPEKRTWRRAKATPNASRLLVGDRDELPLEGMQVNVLVDGFRARVLLDCYYYNNHARQLEGSFKLRLPNEASLYYFAFGQTSFEYTPMVDQLASNGFLPADLLRASGTGPEDILKARSDTWANVKEARIVPREKAAHAYSETVRRRVDPALVEWSGAGVFNAKVYPLFPNKLHRIVIGYDVNLRQAGDDLVYDLDLPEDAGECSVDLNVAALPGATVDVKPAARPFTSNGRAYYHFDNLAGESVEVRQKEPGTILLSGNDGLGGDFFATRFTPDLDAGEEQVGSSRAIFLLDTSLSSRPDKFNIWLNMLETTLEKNRDTIKEFGVVLFNVEAHWWGKGYQANNAKTVDELAAYCKTLSLEGATDLRAALVEALDPSWRPHTDSEDDIRPDIFLLSDGAATWGELNLHRIAGVLKQGQAGSLFAYKTGLTGTAVGALEYLARESGGAVFALTGEDEIAAAAIAHRHRPWQLLDATVTGGSDILIAGRARSIYPGQSLLLVGRGKPSVDAVLKLRRGDERKTLQVPLQRVVSSDMAARVYGQVAVGQLEDLQSATHDVSVAYARHFRVTGQTCSLLMLDSQADYQRFNIKPEDDATVVRASAAATLIAQKLDEWAEQLDDPKAAMTSWLERMEKMPGVGFRIPTALRLAIDTMPRKSFEVEIPRLVCKQQGEAEMSKKFFAVLGQERLDYDSIVAEAERRREQLSAADALKTLSSLIENNPGNLVLTRDVAFSAIQWKLAGQAYPLLKRVAAARPYEPQVYLALAQCLAELGAADLAMIYYEVALTGQWNERYGQIQQIAAVEYSHLLKRIDTGELETTAPEFAKARLEAVADIAGTESADLIITMMWNTDRTDVDLHVLEPSGEECFYKNPQSRAGGRVTRDVTQGFGPEMYTIEQAQHGNYRVMAKYYGSDTNRTHVRTKVYLTIYEGFGGRQQRVSKKTVLLGSTKDKLDVATVKIEK